MSRLVVPYVTGRLDARVAEAARRECSEVQFHWLSAVDPWAYADLMRRLWREPGDLVILEQDTIPPRGAIAELATCPHMWCTHPHWVGDRYQLGTLGLARFSERLRRLHPNLAENALSAPDGRAYTRQGLTRIAPDATDATVQRFGLRACLKPDMQMLFDAEGLIHWPSTTSWQVVDTKLRVQLEASGIEWHVHPQPTLHLHAYDAVERV